MKWTAGWLVVAVFAACGGSSDLPDNGGGDDAGIVYDDCQKPSDCVVRPASCCGQCGAATREDIVALNEGKVSAYTTAQCGDAFGCPACYMAQDARLIATCEANRCKVVDLAAHASTTCGSATDCRVRTNVCCECGGPMDVAHIAAISREDLFSALVCDPGQACPECAPMYPAGVTAVCSAGHCEAVWAAY